MSILPFFVLGLFDTISGSRTSPVEFARDSGKSHYFYIEFTSKFISKLSANARLRTALFISFGLIIAFDFETDPIV
jgi:hypothetical protein